VQVQDVSSACSCAFSSDFYGIT